MIFKKNFILLLIIAVGIFLRFYNLSLVPPSASLDEASIGYNAYSILNTGADEYGNQFPLLLRAYDDWRPALYVYLVVPFVKIFGLNVSAVRMPSVILSVATLIAVYFLIKELFKKKEPTINKGLTAVNGEYVALLTTFLLAISPWHIYISRLGHEANAGLSFFIFALLFFLKRRIYLSTILFVLSFMSYQAEKIFLPLLLLGLVFVYRREMIKTKGKVLIALFLMVLILTPFIKETLSPDALIRFNATSVFNSQKERFDKEAILLAQSYKDSDLIGKVVHNRRIIATQIVLESYISHFNPTWLFLNPSADRHKVPNLGLLFPWEFPFILIGFFVFIFSKLNPNFKKIILLWFFFAPLAGALTSDAPHAMRAYTFLPSFQIFSALGIIYSFLLFRRIRMQKLFIAILAFVVIVSVISLFRQYFTVFPKTQSSSFQYALSKAVPFVLIHEKPYNRIIFSNQGNLYQSYMFFLFYGKYDPLLYQKEGGTVSGGFAEAHKFGKYEFNQIDLKKNIGNKTLLIGNTQDFFDKINSVSEFGNLDGIVVIKAVKL